VTERLFRMWREMRTETGRARLGFLIRFLNLWYTPTQLVDETGKLLNQLGETQEHEKPRLLLHLQYLKEATPELLRPELEKVYSYAEAGRLELATSDIPSLKELASCEESVKANPDDAMAWLNHGWALGKLGKYEEALNSFDRTIQIQTDFATAWYNRGLALYELDRYEEALESYDRAIQFQLNLVPAWNNRGVVLRKLGRYKEALENYGRAAQLKPDDAMVWSNRGNVLYYLGRYEEAVESLDKTIQLQPNDTTVWCNRGFALSKLGKYEDALESCERAIQLQPDFAMAWNNRGIALVNLGKHDEALKSLKKALELANAQNLEDTSEFAAMLAAATELSTSLQALVEDNLGSARRALQNAIDSGKQSDAGDFQLLLFGYLKGALKSGKIQFVQEALEIIVSGLGEEYNELLRPFKIALEYMQTEDVSILERLQQEERELVLEIAGQTKK